MSAKEIGAIPIGSSHESIVLFDLTIIWIGQRGGDFRTDEEKEQWEKREMNFNWKSKMLIDE